jgi:formamidopyrimidine-DNA glycosylase
MPELPEVETTCRGLRSTVMGLSITDFWCDWEKMCSPKPSAIKSRVLHAKIDSIERKGKNILIHLSTKETLLLHLKMTGHLMYGTYKKINGMFVPDDQNKALHDPYNRFIHAAFSLSDGKTLVFCDARKFGKIELLTQKQLSSHSRISSLGPEPIDNSFTVEHFKNKLRAQKRSLKPLLLDQSVFSGIGNIYADESLFRSKIHPLRISNMLQDSEIEKLYTSVREVLQTGIDFGGDSTSDYRNIFGERGSFHGKHKVYRRTNKPCLNDGCEGTIQRIVVGGRGTHICPRCQTHI